MCELSLNVRHLFCQLRVSKMMCYCSAASMPNFYDTRKGASAKCSITAALFEEGAFAQTYIGKVACMIESLDCFFHLNEIEGEVEEGLKNTILSSLQFK